MELNAGKGAVGKTVAVAGATGLLAQVVLLREILASSQGNELVLGFAMAAWLCLTGLASVLGARFAGTRGHAVGRLAVLFLGALPLLFTSLWLTRFVRPNALGQEPSLWFVLVITSLALAPASALGGLSYAWAAAALDDTGQAPSIYVAENLGAAAAGVIFHFFFADHLSGAWILLVAGTNSAAAGAALTWPRRRFLVVAVLAGVVALGAAPVLDRSLEAARLPGEQVLALQPSRYGLVAVVARGQQRVFFHDGVLLFTSEDDNDAEEIIHLPLLLHPHPRRVLLIGGGLGGGLAQALEHRPEVLDYAEIDPEILSLARKYASPRTRSALADPRVHAATIDGRRLLREAALRYDVILVNTPVAQNALLARFSTRECFEEARRALAPGGIFVVGTPGSDAYLDPAARQRHASLLATLRSVFPAVGIAPGAQTTLWGSQETVDARPQILIRRLGDRGIRPLRIGRAWIFDRLMPFHVEGYRRSLATVAAVVNRDFRPVVYLFGLIESLERLTPALGRGALWFVRAPWAGWVLAGGILPLAALGFLLRRRRGARGFAAASAGAAGMSLELVLMLAFQALVGHLYHALGGMLAGFMAGMAAGAFVGGKASGKRAALVYALGTLATVAALVPVMLLVARAAPAASVALVFAGIVLAGASTGAVYPLAVAAAPVERAVAITYAWDLVGAAGAALIVVLLAIPLLGFFPVAALSAALCTAAALANLGNS